MGYYSDPTAGRALSGINREFSRLEKKAKRLRKLWQTGVITEKDLERAQSQFQGIYRHVLTLTKRDWDEKKRQAAAQSPTPQRQI